nr:sigma-70 family RNA polymerase sigma factor [Brevibacillus invocatus]
MPYGGFFLFNCVFNCPFTHSASVIHSEQRKDNGGEDVQENIEDLIRRAVQEKDQEAFRWLVQIHQGKIYMYCYRLFWNRQEAEDAVQEIFMKVYQRLGEYKPTASFSAWLYKIAYHHCLNELRRKQLMQKVKDIFFSRTEVAAVSAEEIVQDKVFSEPIAKILEKLTLEERNLLVMRIFDEKTFEEMGEIIGKRQETVKKRYERLRKKVRNMITESEEDLYAETYSLP